MMPFLSLMFLSILGVTTTLVVNEPNITSNSLAFKESENTKGYINSESINIDAIKADALCRNLQVYRNALIDYINTDPVASINFTASAILSMGGGATVTVPVNKFPSWFINAGWINYIYVVNGKRYVYVYAPLKYIAGTSTIDDTLTGINAAATTIYKATNGSLLAGQLKNGQFYNASGGYSSLVDIPIPQQAKIPNGSPLYITMLN